MGISIEWESQAESSFAGFFSYQLREKRRGQGAGGAKARGAGGLQGGGMRLFLHVTYMRACLLEGTSLQAHTH